MFTVKIENSSEIVTCRARGLIKQDNRLQAGDKVELEKVGNNEFVISKLLPRKNSLIRPYVSNIDQLVIVIAPLPKPDLLLVDKLLIGCIVHDIEPIIVINKIDIVKNENFVDDIKDQYKHNCKTIITTSAKQKIGVLELKNSLKNKLSAFTGQSAVGKTSLINEIFGNLNLKTDGLSTKINIGKNTTRDTQIYYLENDTLIADSPGFNMLHNYNIESSELSHYYYEFNEHGGMCKFSNCSHITESSENCAVISAVKLGKINKERYNRYKELYLKLKEIERGKYD